MSVGDLIQEKNYDDFYIQDKGPYPARDYYLQQSMIKLRELLANHGKAKTVIFGPDWPSEWPV